MREVEERQVARVVTLEYQYEYAVPVELYSTVGTGRSGAIHSCTVLHKILSRAFFFKAQLASSNQSFCFFDFGQALGPRVLDGRAERGSDLGPTSCWRPSE